MQMKTYTKTTYFVRDILDGSLGWSAKVTRNAYKLISQEVRCNWTCYITYKILGKNRILWKLHFYKRWKNETIRVSITFDSKISRSLKETFFISLPGGKAPIPGASGSLKESCKY